MTEEQATKRPRLRSRNKVSEPECLTLSSDEKTGTPCSNGAPSTLPQVTDNTKKLTSEQLIKPKYHHLESDEKDRDEEMEVDMVEEQKVAEEEPLTTERQLIIPCRSVRVGSFRIHPEDAKPYIEIFVSATALRFQVPTVKNGHEMATIVLTENDIEHALGHFGRCLPILYIFCVPACGERIRKQLHMTQGEIQYFDPEGKNDRQKMITFLLELVSEEHKNFLRHFFPGDGILKEVDQKLANEILVKSTPQHNRSTKTVPVEAKPTVPEITAVTKILTYPFPVQNVSIGITNADLLCLEKGEILNDAIVNFYLKYLINEKLSERDRQRTHIFSTYFYHSLRKKLKAGDEALTWSDNVDIFEKDFIIVPVNHNVHWSLAIICFPGLVPESESQHAPSKESEKSIGNLSATNARKGCESRNLCSQKNCMSSIRKNITIEDQSCSIDDQISGETLSLVVSSYIEELVLEVPDSAAEVPEVPDRPDKFSKREKMPCILLFDSMSRPKLCRIAKTLRQYLNEEWKNKKGTDGVYFSKKSISAYLADVPQQTDHNDCGIYVLQYVDSFFEDPFPYFSYHMPRLPNWFSPEKVANKREEIKSLILKLQKRQISSTTNKDSRPNVMRKKP